MSGTRLGCPECGAVDDLAFLERLLGSALVNSVRVEDGQLVVDWDTTEIDYDSSESYGIECRSCGWRWFVGDEEETAPAIGAAHAISHLKVTTD